MWLMGGVISLSSHSEFLALLATLPSKAPIHKGEVPASPTFPYVLVTRVIPYASERSLNRTVHARTSRWLLTIAGLNDTSVGIIAEQCQQALEGARIGGQRLEEIPNRLGIEPDLDVTLPNGSNPLFTKQEWHVSN